MIYVGPDDDTEAIAFMRRLAAAGLGRVIINDLRRAAAGQPQLGAQIKGLLTGG